MKKHWLVLVRTTSNNLIYEEFMYICLVYFTTTSKLALTNPPLLVQINSNKQIVEAIPDNLCQEDLCFTA